MQDHGNYSILHTKLLERNSSVERLEAAVTELIIRVNQLRSVGKVVKQGETIAKNTLMKNNIICDLALKSVGNIEIHIEPTESQAMEYSTTLK